MDGNAGVSLRSGSITRPSMGPRRSMMMRGEDEIRLRLEWVEMEIEHRLHLLRGLAELNVRLAQQECNALRGYEAERAALRWVLGQADVPANDVEG